MALGWSDAAAIARRLHERFPERDPLALRMPDLERWVAEIAGFEGPPGAPDPRLLEAIQQAWYREYER